MRFRSIRFLVMALPAALAIVASAPSHSSVAVASSASAGVVGASTAAGPVRIEVRYRSATRGTFTVTGTLSDKGPMSASSRVANRTLRVTVTLVGREGTIRIQTLTPCAGRSGTWKILSGSARYRGVSGAGNARGGPRCASSSYPAAAVYAGVVRTPAPPTPPQLAQPGTFGGGTSQHMEVLLTVDSGGRTFSGLRFAVDAPCTGPTALSMGRVSISFPDPRDIGPDGSFTLPSPATFWTGTVSGRFSSPTTVQGTATVSTQTTTSVGTYACSASVTWAASLPPPAAPAGRYCGFTLQGPGICLDVAPSGREVTAFESAVVVRCFPGGVAPSEIEVSLTFSGSIPIGGHLGFSSGRIPVAGLISGTASIGGLFDRAGTASGTVSLGPAVLEFEGTRYNCHPATGRWEARRP